MSNVNYEPVEGVSYDSSRRDSTEISHESFGVISVSKFSSSRNIRYFGSDIPHREGISLQIAMGDLSRHKGYDFIHEKGCKFIEITMSPAQFADIMSNMNSSGVPCTIKYVPEQVAEYIRNGTPYKMVRLEDCPKLNRLDMHKDEITNHFKTLLETAQELLSELKETKMTKTAQEKLCRMVERIIADLEGNMSFNLELVRETLGNMAQDVKRELEAYAHNNNIPIGMTQNLLSENAD